MKRLSGISAVLLLGLLSHLNISCHPTDYNVHAPERVTTDNFIRAETDMYFATVVKEAKGVGAFIHYKELMPVNKQTIIRPNRDVLYSFGVFDLDAGPVTVTLPDPAGRYMSMTAVNEDHYTETVYAPGTFTYTKEQMGTRYVLFGIRTFINPTDPQDLKRVSALQKTVKVGQENKGSFDIPQWDKISQKIIHDSLVDVARSIRDMRKMFGTKNEVDSVRHLIGTATGWGGGNEKDVMYITITPPENDGKTMYELTVKDVPVDGFWSVSVYNKKGYFEKNDLKNYTFNNVTSKKNADSSITIRFGGCDGNSANCIPITPGWNYWVRLYRPRKEILDGTWTFPEARAVN